MIDKLRVYWRKVFDIREGEAIRVACLSFYLLSLLFAYYILKPVSRALFLKRLDPDSLPVLYILIAAVGGILAYAYTKLAVKTSLKTAVNTTLAFFVFNMVLIWWMLQYNLDWMYFAFNIWVSVFSIVSVSQGWLIAANVFDPRQAKRLYGLLGVSAVIGAAFGGEFTRNAVKYLAPRDLVLASAVMVVVAFAIFQFLLRQRGVRLEHARGADVEETEFSFKDIWQGVVRYRHLQVIIWIISLTYVVDVMVDYQFNVQAEATFKTEEELTAFLGSFYGLYLNLVTFVLQLFLTAIVVRTFGVAGALQIMPVAIMGASVATYLSPNVLSTSAARLTEAATRYSFNRTGMELLYLPLPTELRNRTKAFVDVFVDRAARGVGGILLLALVVGMGMQVHNLSLLVMGLCILWIFLSTVARKEYIATVRRRLESRRLDLENVRISMRDPATLKLLESTLSSKSPRQAAYALSQLADAPTYPLEPKLLEMATSEHAQVRAKVFELARTRKFPDLLDSAMAGIDRAAPESGDAEVTAAAVAYALSISPQASQLAIRLLDHPSPTVTAAALATIAEHSDLAPDLITIEWLRAAAEDPSSDRRRMGALGVRARGDQGTEVLHKLLLDPDPRVASAAAETAGALGNRAYLDALVRHLGNPVLRGAAISALSWYGPRIVGTLADFMHDERLPMSIRRQIPRVLRNIPHQRSVDVLLESIDEADLTIRTAVLRALNHLREQHPNLHFGPQSVTRQILAEARYYYELAAALEPFREFEKSGTAVHLLVRTLESRLKSTVERLFRLLGLRYPPKPIYAAYLAVHRRRPEEFSAALEFLDSVLERELKRVLLPLLDEDASHSSSSGAAHFGVHNKTAGIALRELLESGDSWLASCAIAAAAELRMRELAPVIRSVSQRAGHEVALVAQPALVALV